MSIDAAAVTFTRGRLSQARAPPATVGAATLMSGKPGDGAFVDLRSIGGLGDEVNRKLSQQVCKLLKDSLGISPDRVYLNFTDVEAVNWGWNGSTFG